MRRLPPWLAGLVGGAALYRLLRRRPRPAPAPPPAPDPAAELRAKLAETRAGGEERGDDERGAEPVPDEAGGAPDVESRRRSVHSEARAAIDEMRGD